ncbi:tRNA (guanine(46)-N(7))-methyltransferase TrmB [Brachybacterium sp. JHP9]|uniref:tRNA (guanine-N(7)-)-methyltransferase n=1 Tax=Brachybacterium equifaecis TaxID=2910770 RepID=A0ABT0QX84_9MICO|nr:tRNA (guanine(46)-N(7))-methyltransferase TrmB [Brachybacterium equifaecis]MCL6422195.1 tRNA (guanine(46)-N(7))-methyltransferase TrmB [Brachybacterium equifaecis]
MPPAEPAEASGTRRDVVSFVRRGTRLTRSRQAAWDRLAPTWVLDIPLGDRDTIPRPDARLDLEAEYGRRAPLVVEIGSGLGENIAAAAARDGDRDHLAFEVYAPGIAQTLDRIEKAGSPRNVRLAALDAPHALPVLLPPRSIDEVWIFFPDPWHKSRHHKRRIVNPPLLDALAPLLREEAVLRLATDWAQYAFHMREVLDADPRFAPLHPDGERPDVALGAAPSDPIPETMPARGWAPRFEGRVLTSFERKAGDAGRISWDLAYRFDPAHSAAPSPAAGDRTPGESA